MSRRKTDILIVGAGIIGLTIARELVRRKSGKILIIEKEEKLGAHASGRNSGVLHAGIYYSPDSLKAKTCIEGNLLMREYCREKDLPLHDCGKLIVATKEEELPVLDELYERGKKNGSPVEMVDEKRASEIEPAARVVKRALYSPLTAVVDPLPILHSLKRDLEESGTVEFLSPCRYLTLKGPRTALTSTGEVEFSRFINASGAYCDRVAVDFGVGKKFRLIPFKGIYRKLRREKAHLVRGNIYPVPDISYPFLGVHFTRSIHGEVYIGPTATPALGRENYGILRGLDSEAPSILLTDALLFLKNPAFRRLAIEETRKYIPSRFFKDASRLVRGLTPEDIVPSEKAGIRAQLVDRETGDLVTDFVVESTEESVHILNPISPAFTSSMSIARQIADRFF
ncbi:MAG: L-2-hydroxyglutarate oxidase [Deltaproteobacteria bacterium]|nr:MAG: L-2-hydroxyglutarate oxidase [Deltaproteobacteria bacterium]